MKIVAKAILYNRVGEVLVLRRSNTHPRFALHLDFPGGEVEPGETGPIGVAREILEETGLLVAHTDLALVHSERSPSGSQHLVFRANTALDDALVTLSWEHDQFSWLSPQQLAATPVPEGVDSYYLAVMRCLAT